MVRPVGRLDRETSGIVVFAKNSIAAARLQDQREKGIFQKKYLAVVEGYLPVDGLEYQIDEPIKPDPENGLSPTIRFYRAVRTIHWRKSGWRQAELIRFVYIWRHWGIPCGEIFCMELVRQMIPVRSFMPGKSVSVSL